MLPAWLGDAPNRLLVVGAYSGAGSSSVAVAVSEAAARGCPPGAFVHLVDCVPAPQSGLAGVTDAELGVGDCGLWRHGRRGSVVVSRPVGAPPPIPPDPGTFRSGASAAQTTVFDLGPATDVDSLDTLGGLVRDGAGPGTGCVLVVFRTTLPGLRRVEAVLSALDVPNAGRGRVVVAAVGPPRWPRVVRVCAGPHLQQARQDGRVVPVPVDRHMAVTGIGSGPLPRKVAAAGARLWALCDGPPKPHSLPFPFESEEYQ